MSDQRFRVLVADPPWKFGDALPGNTRGAAKQYKCLTLSQIMRFPLPLIDEPAILFLWRVASMQQDALDVCRAWGFTPKSEIIWEKLTKTGRPHFGMGRFVRASHETCLVATRGRYKVASRSVRSRFAAKMPVDPCGKIVHSAKPDEFFEIVEQLTDSPRVELFARRHRPGWVCLGDQVGIL